MNIRNLMEDWEKVRSCVVGKQTFTNTDMYVNSKRKKQQFNISAYPHLDDNQKIRNIVMVFQEVKKIRRMASKIMGHQALYTFDKLKGQDENFVRIVEYAKKIADSRSNVLIMGESGTGKELFAQAIHNYSSRHDEPFVALNCGAIPRNLIETELFGYEGGAFTGSKSAGQPGKFEIADGGTIFLDEIGEMPLDLQTRLLRVIEEGTVSRVGSVKEIKVDVRVIAATNKDLSEEVRSGNFRTDLFYRLNVLPIRLLPLRDRKTDIPLLSRYFMDVISRRLGKHTLEIDTETMKAFVKYEWPGNVRELENVIEQMINTQSIPEIFMKPDRNQPVRAEAEPSLPNRTIALEAYEDILNLEMMERNCIEKALDLYHGNISLCARALGIGRNTLYRKMDAYGIKSAESEQHPNLS
jgi:transcriptional regulator with PAS, ATPase and Fis domain